MSFSKNLVEAECGGQNPLVSAAQHLNIGQQLPGSELNPTGPSSTVDFGNLANEFLKANSTIGPLSNNFKLSTHPIIHINPLASSADPLSNQWTREYETRTSPNWASDFALTAQSLQSTPQSTPQATIKEISGSMLSSKIANMRLSYTNSQVVEETVSLQLEAKAKHDLESTVRDEEVDEQDLQFWQDLAQRQGIDPEAWYNTDFLNSRDIDQRNGYVFINPNPFCETKLEDSMSEGLKRLEQGDIPSAVLLFEAAAQQDGNNTLAWRYLGTTQAQNENDVMAIKALEQCLRLDENDMDARMALAVSLSNETQHRRACQQLTEWLKRHPKYSDLLDKNFAVSPTRKSLSSQLGVKPNAFGALFVGDEEYNEICDVLVEAARLCPDNPDPDVQCALGVIFNMRGQYAKAIDCFKAALSVQPNNSLLWNRLGAVQANGSRPEEAVSAYKQALKLSPGFLRSRYNLAISCINLNAYREAAEQLVTVLNIQAAGRGLRDSKVRNLTSSNVWNTLRTVALLMDRPDLNKHIDSRDLGELNREFPTRCWPDGTPAQCKSCAAPSTSSNMSPSSSNASDLATI